MSFATESGPENVVTIKVVGVGGAGNNVVNRMVKSGTQGIEYVAVNTDKQALAVSSADQKIQIGEKLTHGQGAGSDPDVGKRSAEESRNNIAKSLENADMVFITAGMGGGTGTGAAPTIADIAREAGILTVGVVTKPFKFEGKRRMDQAMVGINELLGKVDSLLIIPNDRLKFATDQKVTLANAFEIADDLLRRRQGQGGGRCPHGRCEPAHGDVDQRCARRAHQHHRLRGYGPGGCRNRCQPRSGGCASGCQHHLRREL